MSKNKYHRRRSLRRLRGHGSGPEPAEAPGAVRGRPRCSHAYLEPFQKFPGRPADGDLGPEGTQVPEKGKTRPSDSPGYFVGGVCSMSRSTSSACNA